MILNIFLLAVACFLIYTISEMTCVLLTRREPQEVKMSSKLIVAVFWGLLFGALVFALATSVTIERLPEEETVEQEEPVADANNGDEFIVDCH